MSSKHDSSLGQISLCYPGVLPIMVYTGAPTGRGTFFRPQVYKRVRILLVEVYKGLGKSVIRVCERA